MGYITNDIKDFYSYLTQIKSLGQSFSVENHRTKRSICIGNNQLKVYDMLHGQKRKESLSQGKTKAFFGMSGRIIGEHILEKGFVIEKIIRKDNKNIFFNSINYGLISDGDYFWAVDIDNSYWQAMYKLGVISQATYTKYYRLHNLYKRIKAMCIGMSASERSRSYYQNGKEVLDKDGKVWVVKEDRSIWKVLYANVRAWSYNIVFDCVMELGGREGVIFYNIDCLMFSFEKRDIACKWLYDRGIDFKLILCRKLNSNYYMIGNELRTIKF